MESMDEFMKRMSGEPKGKRKLTLGEALEIAMGQKMPPEVEFKLNNQDVEFLKSVGISPN